MGNTIKIYQAPLQGFTDCIFRKVYHAVFGSVDTYFIPYISLEGDGSVRKSKLKEVLPEYNIAPRGIPQLLPANEKELLVLGELVAEMGYDEININMGCPYPMVTRRGRGAGLLPYPERVAGLLETAFKTFQCKISVKVRLGSESPDELSHLIPVLNDFSLAEVIVHPRIARQLYKGSADMEHYAAICEKFKAPTVYNGDIFTVGDYNRLLKAVPAQQTIMLGRGLLRNPFLPAEIKGVLPTEDKRLALLEKFHDQLSMQYQQQLCGDGHFLAKMQQFWVYFCHSFESPHKVFKKVKKAKSSAAYFSVVADVLRGD